MRAHPEIADLQRRLVATVRAKVKRLTTCSCALAAAGPYNELCEHIRRQLLGRMVLAHRLGHQPTDYFADPVAEMVLLQIGPKEAEHIRQGMVLMEMALMASTLS